MLLHPDNKSQGCASFKTFSTSADIYCEIREINFFQRDNHKRDKTKMMQNVLKRTRDSRFIQNLSWSNFCPRRPWIPEKVKK